MIQRFPTSKSVVRPPDVRRAIVQGFPYIIVYRVTAQSIRVVSVFHTSRDPSAWQAAAEDDIAQGEK
jgi:plasmid stabilization system protein ParE